VIGVAAPPLFAFSERAAAQLLAVAPYTGAVLGAGGVEHPPPVTASREGAP